MNRHELKEMLPKLGDYGRILVKQILDNNHIPYSENSQGYLFKSSEVPENVLELIYKTTIAEIKR